MTVILYDMIPDGNFVIQLHIAREINHNEHVARKITHNEHHLLCSF
jgi:hypothetical protein